MDPPATCHTHPFQSSGDQPLHAKPRPLLTCVARLACTLIAIDFVDAPPVVTGFALTVIQVYLTVESCRLTHVWVNEITKFYLKEPCLKGLTCSPFGADTNIGVFPVLTSATILAGLAETLIDVSFTETACVARMAVAGERGQSILTGTIVTGVRIALIDIDFTVLPCVTCSGEE